MERKTRIERNTKLRRAHRATLRRAARKAVDLRLKNYLLESHPELGV
jgi:hypothetical protein